MAKLTTKEGDLVVIMEAIATGVKSGNPYRDGGGRFGTGGGGPKKKEAKTVTPNGVATIEDIEALGDLPDAGATREFLPSGDPAMTALTKQLGFNKKPAIIKRSEVAGLKKEGWIEMYRGYRGDKAQTWIKSYANDANPRVGFGVFGSGTYMTPIKSIAEFYGDMNPKNVGSYLISPKAKGISYDAAKKAMLKAHSSIVKKAGAAAKSSKGDTISRMAKSNLISGNIKTIFSDAGRWAAASGYDYISYKGSSGGTEMAVLNRGMVGVIQ